MLPVLVWGRNDKLECHYKATSDVARMVIRVIATQMLVIPMSVWIFHLGMAHTIGITACVLILDGVITCLLIYSRRVSVLTITDGEIIYERGWLIRKKNTISARKIRSCILGETRLQHHCGTVSLLITTFGCSQAILLPDVNRGTGEIAHKMINRMKSRRYRSSARYY